MDTNLSRRKKTGRTREWFFTLLLAAFIGVLSSTVNFDEPSLYRLPITAGILGLILVVSGFKIGVISPKGMVMLFLWSGYATMCVSSAIVNRDSIFGELWQLLGVPAMLLCGIPHYAQRQGIRMVAWGLALGFAPYIFLSLLWHPISSNYEGIFGNPNTMGIVAAAWLGGLLVLLRGHLAAMKRRLRSWVLLGMLFAALFIDFLVLLASSSRTSIGAASLLLILFAWTLLLGGARKQLGGLLVAVGTGVIFTYMLAVSGFVNIGLFQGAAEKFAMNLISGRENIWEETLRQSAVFGHGNQYFFNTFGLVAHNNYIDILGSKGILALIFRFSFDMLALFWAFRLVVKKIKEDAYVVGPLLVLVNYMTIGLTETVNGTLGHGIHAAFLLMIGMLMHYDLVNQGTGPRVEGELSP